jgi:hypothetical protein
VSLQGKLRLISTGEFSHASEYILLQLLLLAGRILSWCHVRGFRRAVAAAEKPGRGVAGVGGSVTTTGERETHTRR